MVAVSDFELEKIDCSKYSNTAFEVDNLTSYFETNPYSLIGDNGYVELDIFPDLNSLKCLGKKSDIKFQIFEISNIYFTSSTLLKIYTISSIIFIITLFTIFSKKNIALFLFLLAVSYLGTSHIFYGKLLLDYQLLSYFIGFILFILFNRNHSENKYSKSFFLFLTLCCLMLIFNYDLYTKLHFIFLIIYFFYFKNKKIDENFLNIIIVFPIIYYSLRQISGAPIYFNKIWETLSASMFRGSAKFSDMVYTLSVLKCNEIGCNTTNNYGPLWEILSLNINVEIYTYLLSIILIFITNFYYVIISKNSKHNSFLYFLIYTSGPMSFLIERMNFDLIAGVTGLFSIYIYKRGNKNLSLLILSLIALVKVFPIFFIVGLLIYEYKNKNKISINHLVFIFIISIGYMVYYFGEFQSGFTPNPSGITWTFGLLSDLENYIKFFGIFGYLLLLLFVFVSIYYVKRFYKYKETLFSSRDNLIEFSFLFTFLPIGLYFNFDYRLIFLVIPLIYIIKNYKNLEFEFFCLLFLSTSVSKFLIVDEIKNNLFDFLPSLLFIILNHLSFYIIFSIIIYEVFRFIFFSKLK